MRTPVVALTAVVLASGCPEPVQGPSEDAGTVATPQGSEGGTCYPNQTCNQGLACLSDLCVLMPDAGQADTLAPDAAMPDVAATDTSAPDATSAADAVPPLDGNMADTATPTDAQQSVDGSEPDASSADDAAAQDGSAPDGAALDATSVDTHAADAASPDTAAADSAAPDTAPWCGDGTVNGDEDCEGSATTDCSSVDPRFASGIEATCDECTWETTVCLEPAVLKWANGGCAETWCQTGWYSSAAVADLDDAGGIEVVGALYSVFALSGETGETLWSHALGGRAWPGVVVADLDDSGDLEVAVASAASTITLVDHNGAIIDTLQPWGPGGAEIRGFAAADIDNNGPLELIATETGDGENLTVVSLVGNTATGWPQVTTGAASSHGIFNANIAVGDIDGD